MTKQTFLLIIGITAVNLCSSQNTTATDVLVKSVCQCMTTKKDSIDTKQEALDSFKTCYVSQPKSILNPAVKELKIKTLDYEGRVKLGNELGRRLAVECPIFKTKLTDMLLDRQVTKTEESPKIMNDSAVIKKAISVFCDCLDKKKSNIKTTSDANRIFKKCNESFYEDDIALELERVLKIKDGDKDGMEKMGNTMHRGLRSNCETYRTKLRPLMK